MLSDFGRILLANEIHKNTEYLAAENADTSTSTDTTNEE